MFSSFGDQELSAAADLLRVVVAQGLKTGQKDLRKQDHWKPVVAAEVACWD
jgi:hypothetical protein